MEDRKILYASEGMVLTDGKTYGKVVYLAEGAEEAVWHEITEEEYETIMASKEAEEADYIASLERLGVE
jgi:phosphoribosyl-ATP pyrophosphohydrolase